MKAKNVQTFNRKKNPLDSLDIGENRLEVQQKWENLRSDIKNIMEIYLDLDQMRYSDDYEISNASIELATDKILEILKKKY